MFGEVAGGATIDYKLTDDGNKITGQFTSTAEAHSNSAGQSFGTVTDHLDDQDLSKPVRDNEATSFGLDIAVTGQFTDKTLPDDFQGQSNSATATHIESGH